jgi:hypothetical protein
MQEIHDEYGPAAEETKFKYTIVSPRARKEWVSFVTVTCPQARAHMTLELWPDNLSSRSWMVLFHDQVDISSTSIAAFLFLLSGEGQITILQQQRKLYIFHKNREISILTMKKKQQG